MSCGERRLQRRVGTSGAATQSVVIELDDIGDVVEQRADRFVGPLDMAKVARVLNDHRRSLTDRVREPVDTVGEPFGDVDDPCAERAARPPCRADRRSPSSQRHILRSSPGLARRPASTTSRALANPTASSWSPAWTVQRPATSRSSPGHCNRRSGQSDQRGGVAVRLALPSIHHTTGEQPHVGAGRLRPAPPGAAGVAGTRDVRDETESLPDGDRCRTGEQHPMARQHAESESLPPRGDPPRRSASVVRVCSINEPNCTPLGHAVSHPRHCTQVSTKSMNSSSIASSPLSTARIASMRPRGEYFSSPVTRNVGQCGRHSPQLTHVAANSASSPSTDTT